jgi:hypothetical protein
MTEMLVAMSVLILLMTFIAQMMSSTQVSVNLSGRHLDADSQARLVFDRMAEDFSAMTHRTDVDFLFVKEPTPAQVNATGSNDKMFFFSESPAFYASLSPSSAALKDTAALIGYCINTSTNNANLTSYSLLRLSRGLVWDASPATSGSQGAMLSLTYPPPSTSYATPYPTTTLSSNPYLGPVVGNPLNNYTSSDLTSSTIQSDYDVLANEVIRLEFCFQVKDLTKPNVANTVYSNYPIAWFAGTSNNRRYTQSSAPGTANIGDRWYDTTNNRALICTGTNPIWTPNGMADVRAVVVAIAILDTNSRKVVSNGQLNTISGLLQDPTEDANTVTGLQTQPPKLMNDIWQSTIDGTAGIPFFTRANIPKTVASQVRVYQRFFYLNNQ